MVLIFRNCLYFYSEQIAVENSNYKQQFQDLPLQMQLLMVYFSMQSAKSTLLLQVFQKKYIFCFRYSSKINLKLWFVLEFFSSFLFPSQKASTDSSLLLKIILHFYNFQKQGSSRSLLGWNKRN